MFITIHQCPSRPHHGFITVVINRFITIHHNAITIHPRRPVLCVRVPFADLCVLAVKRLSSGQLLFANYYLLNW